MALSFINYRCLLTVACCGYVKGKRYNGSIASCKNFLHKNNMFIERLWGKFFETNTYVCFVSVLNVSLNKNMHSMILFEWLEPLVR